MGFTLDVFIVIGGSMLPRASYTHLPRNGDVMRCVRSSLRRTGATIVCKNDGGGGLVSVTKVHAQPNNCIIQTCFSCCRCNCNAGAPEHPRRYVTVNYIDANGENRRSCVDVSVTHFRLRIVLCTLLLQHRSRVHRCFRQLVCMLFTSLSHGDAQCSVRGLLHLPLPAVSLAQAHINRRLPSVAHTHTHVHT